MRGPTVADQVTGLQASNAIMAMLRAKQKSGEGGRIDISMIDAAASFIPDVYAGHTDAGVAMEPEARAASSQAFVMPCADGKLIAIQLGALDKAFFSLVEVLGRPDLLQDPLFSTREARVANWPHLLDVIRPLFKTQPRDAWMPMLLDKGVPCSEVLTIPEVITCAEIVHSGLFESREHPAAGPMTMIKRAARINNSRGPAQAFPPLLGEHTEAVLRDVGYSEDDIRRMSSAGTVGQG